MTACPQSTVSEPITADLPSPAGVFRIHPREATLAGLGPLVPKPGEMRHPVVVADHEGERYLVARPCASGATPGLAERRRRLGSRFTQLNREATTISPASVQANIAPT